MKTANSEISHALQSLREQRIALSPKPLLALVKVALLAHLDVHLVVHLDAPTAVSNGLRGPWRRKGLLAREEGSFSAGITAW